MSLLLWEAIKHARTVTRTFDFEGSMIEPIERFFRAFGGTLTSYLHVSGGRTRRGRLTLLAQEAWSRG
jgi:hypothetical protein